MCSRLGCRCACNAKAPRSALNQRLTWALSPPAHGPQHLHLLLVNKRTDLGGYHLLAGAQHPQPGARRGCSSIRVQLIQPPWRATGLAGAQGQQHHQPAGGPQQSGIGAGRLVRLPSMLCLPLPIAQEYSTIACIAIAAASRHARKSYFTALVRTCSFPCRQWRRCSGEDRCAVGPVARPVRGLRSRTRVPAGGRGRQDACGHQHRRRQHGGAHPARGPGGSCAAQARQRYRPCESACGVRWLTAADL